LGDLYIQIVVETPQNLSKRQREQTVQEFDESQGLEGKQPAIDRLFLAHEGPFFPW
jgi:DnaJ-class molecular chaperone